MKKTLYFLFIASASLLAQSTDYYESIQQLSGTALEDALHDIIKDHNEFSYTSSKNILKLADEDPNNADNIILIYTGNSIDKNDFSSNFQEDFWNREHVWVKSQGGFTGDGPYGGLGAYSDAHNLKPCDASVNSSRGTKDFDNGGDAHSEATECNFTSNTWEPRDEVKGDVARILFYMDTRYEGDEGEPNLTLVDYINNSSDPLHGKLSTLLEWNEQDPVDAFERRRNQIIFNWQQNRNPFVDYPELANLIWADATSNLLVFDNVELSNNNPLEDDNQEVYAQIFNQITTPIQEVVLKWGTSWSEVYDESLENFIQMTEGAVAWAGSIPAYPEGTDVKYRITATSEGAENTFYGNYFVALNPFEGTLTSIQDVQGDSDYSPYENQTISTKGVVTAVLGDDFYMQDGVVPRSGIYIYSSPIIPSIGDSVIVTGEVSEFQYNDPTNEKMTELAFPDQVYILSSNNPIPNPIDISTENLPNEDYEGMLVKVSNVTVSYATFNFDDYGQWSVTDGTGDCYIHNTEEGYEYPAVLGEYISSITGICTYLFGDWKIDLRIEDDVEAGVDVAGPVITEVAIIDETTIAVYFNEDVELASAETISNYSIDNDAIITDASRHPFQNARVTLAVQDALNGNYTLTAENINDLLGNTTPLSVGYFQLIGISENHKSNVLVYPNPTTGQLSLTGLLENKSIEIVNTLGEVVFKTQAHNKELYLNLNLENGLYFILYNNISSPLIIAQ